MTQLLEWSTVEKELFTPEEIAASKVRVVKMIELAHTREVKYDTVT